MSKALRPVSVAGIEFDALMNEDLLLTADTPEYPIETGFVVSDSIILKPQVLNMTLFLTDTPVTWARRLGSGQGRVNSVIKRLGDAYFSRELVTVVTTDKTYVNMAITSITITKSTETGYAREIPISFKEVRVTKSSTTTIPASYGKSGATGSNAGTAGTKTGSTPAASGTTGSGSGSSGTSSGGSGSSGASSKAGSILYSLAASAGML